MATKTRGPITAPTMIHFKTSAPGKTIMTTFPLTSGHTPKATHATPRGMRFWFWLLAGAAFVAWTVAAAASCFWFYRSDVKHEEENALNHALSLVEKDLLYRKWVALHGGVYAPVSDMLSPNPYLSVPERDLETPSGKRLTLVNPAYMTRLVHALGVEMGKAPSHLASLRPIHPANSADLWEKKALLWLEENTHHAYYAEKTPIPEGHAVQVMVPLRLEKPCLRCHTDPQDVVGAIRGGIRVTVPISRSGLSHHFYHIVTGHGMMWLFGMMGIGLACLFVHRRLHERENLLARISTSEKFWRSVLNALQDPLILLDQNLHVQLLNPAAAALADVAPEDAVGRPCHEVFSHWHVHSGMCEPERCCAVETLKTNRSCFRLMEIRLHDGSSRVFHVLSSPLDEESGNGPGVIQSFRDITDEVDARRELAERHREMALLFDHMFGGFALHEILTDERGIPVDYRFLKVNRAFEALTGLKADEILGRTLREVLPDALQDWVQRYGQTALQGEPQEFEAFEPSLGRYFSVRAYQSEPGKFVTLFFDVTERKKAEEALRRSETFFRELFEKSAEPQLLVDPSTGKILDVNERAERFYGWSRTEMKEKSYGDLSQNPGGLEREKWTPSVPGPGKIFLERHRTASGEIRTVEISIGPVTLNGVPYLLCFVHDVTEREKLQEQLRQAQKMETIGQLSSGVAHEFNNILQVINGFTEMALADTPEESPNRERLHKVMENGLKGARLVQQLLAFSRKQVLQPEPVNLDEFLGAFLKLAQKLVGESIQVRHVPAASEARVKIDRHLMEQVFWNLVVNARDAMPEGGEITFETAHVVLDEDYVKSHPYATPGPYVMVAVTDTGCGMTPDVLGRIFDPFFTTKAVGKGTGLGLSVAFGIVKQHGGLINVYSEPGRGTTFRIYLRPCEESESSGRMADGQEISLRGKETILVAEDDAAVREYLVEVLRGAGYEVLEAGNGLDAVELFLTTPKNVDLVVCDLIMPGMGGEEAVGLIRRANPKVPAVFLSGYTGRTNGLPQTLTARTAFLEKPIRRSALLRSLRSLLERSNEDLPC